MPKLLIPRLRIVMQELSCLKPVNPAGDLLYVIVGGVNGDGSKAAEVEPRKGAASGAGHGWALKGGVSKTDPEILYDERLAPMETATIRVVFCEGKGGASPEARELGGSLAHNIANAPPMLAFVMGMIWNPPDRILGGDHVIGNVSIQAQNLGDKLSSVIMVGSNTTPAEKDGTVNSSSLEINGNGARYRVTINLNLTAAV